MPWGWTVANTLVFRKVRQALGLDRARICMTAAAPIMRDTLDFFASLNIRILEIYGMSETSGKFSVLLVYFGCLHLVTSDCRLCGFRVIIFQSCLDMQSPYLACDHSVRI